VFLTVLRVVRTTCLSRGDYVFISTRILIGRDIHLRSAGRPSGAGRSRGGWDRTDFIAVPVVALLMCSGASRSNGVAGEGLPTPDIVPISFTRRGQLENARGLVAMDRRPRLR
jgi:hypothetical protein